MRMAIEKNLGSPGEPRRNPLPKPLLSSSNRDDSAHVSGAVLRGCFPRPVEADRCYLRSGEVGETRDRAVLLAVDVDRRERPGSVSIQARLAAIAEKICVQFLNDFVCRRCMRGLNLVLGDDLRIRNLPRTQARRGASERQC